MDLRELENESLLLLYEAGELSAADRAEVDALLTTDAAMRRQLDELRSVQRSALGWLDAAESRQDAHPFHSEQIVSAVGSIMRRWNVRRMARPSVVVSTPSRIGWWAWSAGGLVAAMLTFCIWWGFSGDAGRTSIASNLVPQSSSSVRSDASPTLSPTGTSPDVAPVAAGTPARAIGTDAGARSEDVFLAMDGSSQRLAQLEQDVHDDPRVED